jgi:plastocyanin
MIPNALRRACIVAAMEPHTVVSDTGLYRSAALDQNDTFTFRFEKPAIYKYTCSIHPKMVGTIVVQ